jgi:hypothetical protein
VSPGLEVRVYLAPRARGSIGSRSLARRAAARAHGERRTSAFHTAAPSSGTKRTARAAAGSLSTSPPRRDYSTNAWTRSVHTPASIDIRCTIAVLRNACAYAALLPA